MVVPKAIPQGHTNKKMSAQSQRTHQNVFSQFNKITAHLTMGSNQILDNILPNFSQNTMKQKYLNS